MAFVPKEWKDRLVEFAGRRKLTNVATGEEIIVDVARNEGAVSQEGDALNAANLNDLEQRVKDGFDEINSDLSDCFTSVSNGKSLVASAITDKGVTTASDATFTTMATNIRNIKSNYQFAFSYQYVSGQTYTVCTSKYTGTATLCAVAHSDGSVSITIYQNSTPINTISNNNWTGTVACKAGDVFKFVTNKNSGSSNLWGLNVLIISGS